MACATCIDRGNVVNLAPSRVSADATPMAAGQARVAGDAGNGDHDDVVLSRDP